MAGSWLANQPSVVYATLLSAAVTYLPQANPEMAWVSVADASTTEEALEVLEGYVKTMDCRIKSLISSLDSRFAALNENMYSLAQGEPTSPSRFGCKKWVLPLFLLYCLWWCLYCPLYSQVGDGAYHPEYIGTLVPEPECAAPPHPACWLAGCGLASRLIVPHHLSSHYVIIAPPVHWFAVLPTWHRCAYMDGVFTACPT